MTIPQATLDTITSALKASRVTVELTCYEPGDEEAPQIHRADHHWIKFSNKLDHQERARVAILLTGMSVRQDGIFLKIPTDAAAGDEINNSRDGVSPDPAADEPEAEGEAVDASPKAKPYPTLADVPRRIEPEADELTHEQYLDSEHAMMEAALDEGGEAKAVSTPTPKADPKLPVGIPDVEIPAVADAPPDHTANAQPATPRKDAEPARPLYHTASPHFYNSVAVQVRRKQSSIEIGIRPTELDKLLNDRDVEILHMWGDGANFNVVYWRWVD